MVTRRHMDKLKSGCIVANMGHSVHEIHVDSLKDLKKERIRRHVSHIIWPDGKRIVLLAEVADMTVCDEIASVPLTQGYLVNRVCSKVPSLVFSITSATQVRSFVHLLLH